jgi:hypothetical protein
MGRRHGDIICLELATTLLCTIQENKHTIVLALIWGERRKQGVIHASRDVP